MRREGRTERDGAVGGEVEDHLGVPRRPDRELLGRERHLRHARHVVVTHRSEPANRIGRVMEACGAGEPAAYLDEPVHRDEHADE